MAFDIVVAGPDDYPAAIRPALVAFGEERRTQEQLDDWRLAYDVMHLTGVVERDAWVGTVADYDFTMTVPGGGSVSASGLTMVGVVPTHRRRGIASALLDHSLDQARERGHVVSVLLAAEAGIYGRFGYGVAAQYASAVIDARHAQFLVPPADDGRLEIVDHLEGSRLAEQLWPAYAASQPGAVGRLPFMWEFHRLDREEHRDGASPRYWVVHFDAAGTPDGFATYRVKSEEVGGLWQFRLTVPDLVATTPEVEAVLFGFLCSIDLVREVGIPIRPIEDPLRWRLADPRQLRVTELGDFLWLRLLDVEAPFAARTYGTADELMVEVTDAFRPALAGRYAISGDRSGGSCTRTDAAPDLTLDTSTLASLLLGTVPSSTLAEAGRITATPDALARADAFFASSRAPFACTDF